MFPALKMCTVSVKKESKLKRSQVYFLLFKKYCSVIQTLLKVNILQIWPQVKRQMIFFCDDILS